MTNTTDQNIAVAYTVSCYDTVFANTVNVGSHLTLDAAIRDAEAAKGRCPKSTSRYRIHINPLGYYRVDTPVILSLLF